MSVRSSLFSLLAVLLLASPALSDVINVPNGDFQSPDIGTDAPYASPELSDWQKADQPGWWTGSSLQWYETTGIFYNNPDNQYVGDGQSSQLGFMFDYPGVQLTQQLTDTFQPGLSYEMNVGVQGGGAGMVAGAQMSLEFYYMDGVTPVTIGTPYTITNTNVLTGAEYISSLTNYTASIPIVNATDAWAGKPIGVALVQGSDFSTAGGYWDLDNLHVASVPEPGTMTLLAAAGLGLLMLGARRLLAKRFAAACD